MDQPTSPGPSSPVSSNSTGSLALTPASTIEEMKKVRILALLKDQDLEGDPDILEVRELLQKQNQTVCLQLAWQRRSARPKRNSFLNWVFTLPALQALKWNEGLKVTDLRVVCARWSSEWRRRSAASSTKPLSETVIRKLLGPAEYQSLDQVPWGERYFLESGQMAPWGVWEEELGRELQLVLHHDCLVLAEIPAQPVTRTPAKFGDNKMQCALCGVILSREKDFKEPCLFHPGCKRFDPVSDDDDADDETDDECSIISNQNEYTYLCCNRRASEPGCVIEATHLSFLEVNSLKHWKDGWAQPEAYCASPAVSEE